ncbi:MAG: ABC transporter permease [bacterium]
MILLIIQKEIFNNLLNLRFVIACIVCLILIISSIVVLTQNYENELRDYHDRVITQDNFIDEFGHLNRAGWMARPMREPSRFQPLVLGIDRAARQENFISNPIPVLFTRLDFVTIVTIIMSLMAILFSYNIISGERETGLLRLMLSTSMPRSTIVLGKFIGGNISLVIPFTIGVLAGLLYLAVRPSLQLQTMDLGVFLMLLLASYLYIAAFYGLGLLFSARSHTSNQAVLKSLFAWVLLVLVIPNISPFLAAWVYRIPSATKIEQDLERITSEERDEIVHQRTRQLLQTKFSDLAGIVGMSQNEVQAKAESEAIFRQRYAAYAKAWDEMVKQVNKEQREIAQKIEKTFTERSKYQERLATIFASITPFSNFVFIATDLTETGMEGDTRWQKQAETYLGVLSTYVDEKYQKAMQKNPAFSINDYLDLRDRPWFRYQPTGLVERLIAVLPQFGLLVFFNLFFLACACLSFLRYDVR